MTIKNRSLVIALTLIVMASAASTAIAQEKAVQLSLLAPIQLFSQNTSIAGFRFNLLYGKNASVSGLDWGLVNHTTTGMSHGIQSGLVSIADADFSGGQYGFVDIVRGNLEGMQWGFVNSAHHVHGFQFGVVNYAATMKGLQVGLINIIKSGGQFPVFPIINWSF